MARVANIMKSIQITITDELSLDITLHEGVRDFEIGFSKTKHQLSVWLGWFNLWFYHSDVYGDLA